MIIDTNALKRERQAALPLEVKQRNWRDKQLKSTDYIVSIMDFIPHQDWLDYRTQLRDWPSTDSFPNTRPERPDRPTPTGY